MHAEDMIVRHRLDLAKLYLGKDGGYSLRKFKRIFKREMAEHPEKYMILKKNQNMDDVSVEYGNSLNLNDELSDDEGFKGTRKFDRRFDNRRRNNDDEDDEDKLKKAG